MEGKLSLIVAWRFLERLALMLVLISEVTCFELLCSALQTQLIQLSNLRTNLAMVCYDLLGLGKEDLMTERLSGW